MDLDKNWKQPKCPSANEWIKKLWYIYTMEFYAAERKEEFIPFATAWMELESIMLSEIRQAVREKYHMISSTFFKNLFYCCSITVVCIFSSSLYPTPAKPTSLSYFHPTPWFCLCPL